MPTQVGDKAVIVQSLPWIAWARGNDQQSDHTYIHGSSAVVLMHKAEW